MLAGSSIKFRGFEIPVFFVLTVALTAGIALWGLYEAFGIKPSAITAAVVIEAIAFRALCDGGKQSDSASIWLVKAFALGGLFLFCIALLA